jgi:branched-chain amino acid transport system permease protein
MSIALEQALLAGLLTGMLYALIAVGFALIFGAVRIFNLAHGEFIVIAGYISYWLWSLKGVNPLLSIPISMLLLLALGGSIKKIMDGVKEPFELNTIVFTFGLALFLENLMLSMWSGDYRLISADYLDQSISILGVNTSLGRFLVFAVSLIAIALLYYFLKKTYLGMAMRATSQERDAASLMGINVKSIDLYAFSIGAALAGIAGPLFASIHYIYPAVGLEITIIALVVTIFGGVGEIRGIILGGLILGMSESLTVAFLGFQWRELAGFAMLVILLLLRPYGLLGGRRY